MGGLVNKHLFCLEVCSFWNLITDKGSNGIINGRAHPYDNDTCSVWEVVLEKEGVWQRFHSGGLEGTM